MEVKNRGIEVGVRRSAPPARYATHDGRLIRDALRRGRLGHELIKCCTTARPEVGCWLQCEHRPHGQHGRAIEEMLFVIDRVGESWLRIGHTCLASAGCVSDACTEPEYLTDHKCGALFGHEMPATRKGVCLYILGDHRDHFTYLPAKAF